jgi:Raf kinase inhibitor-like YbhB/YbcL family protein
MELTSPAFPAQGEIPLRYTCEGQDRAPALRWAGVPQGTASLVLIVDDPDAPDPAAPQRTWVHWVLYDIPPTAAGLPEGGRPLPEGTCEGLNDWNRTGWLGPCPPIGRHRYFFKLYALDQPLPPLAKPDKAAVEQAMRGHVLAQAELVGTYRKQRA